MVREVRGVCFAITCREARTIIPEHAHRPASFNVLLSGQHHWVSAEGKIRWSLPGIWYYRAPSESHAHESCATPIRSLGVQFPIEEMPALGKIDSRLVLDHPVGRSLVTEVLEALRCHDPGSEHILYASVHRVAASFLRYGRPVSDQNLRPWLASARQWLDEHWLESVHLTECAAAVGAHPSHLAREFKTAFGMTVGDYIRDRRLEWAYDELGRNDRKVADIAVAAGFSDNAHFSRVFKQRYGKSPSTLRIAPPTD